MTKPRLVNVHVPFFPGFYHSNLSSAIDWEEESHAENVTSEYDHESDESALPEALRLDQSEISSALFDSTDYGAAYGKLARDYVEILDERLGELFGRSVADKRKYWSWADNAYKVEPYRRATVGMRFEAVISPREYNFTTDRLFVDLPVSFMRSLYAELKRDKKTLAETIKARHSSQDGFISFYANDLDSWLGKPFEDFDYNELGTILVAAMALRGADEEFTREIEHATCEDSGPYQAWESAVDWPKYEAKRLELRAPKLLEWIESEPDEFAAFNYQNPELVAQIIAADPDEFSGLDFPELPYRCPATPDIFDGLIGRHV